MKTALVTGVNGQTGSYMADFLLAKGYKVYGLERRASAQNRTNTSHLIDEENFTMLVGDLSDQNSLLRCLRTANPDEVYNFAAQSFVGESWNTPEQTSDITGLGALRMLEAIRENGKEVKFYQASSSEMFGRMVENPANENTPFYPRSPYGVAKLYAHWITKNYRESYGMFNVSGLLFNHESERRGIEFVTRKITDGVAKIYLGMADVIELGNLDAKRDWGYAPDYVEAAWLMMQHHTPEDFVIATGETRTIREFLTVAFSSVGIDDWQPYVKINPAYLRPAEVDILRGDYTKARETLGWEPKTEFNEWVGRMVKADNLRNLMSEEFASIRKEVI
jgi:GDPmannose 4,6-dehydratase